MMSTYLQHTHTYTLCDIHSPCNMLSGTDVTSLIRMKAQHMANWDQVVPSDANQAKQPTCCVVPRFQQSSVLGPCCLFSPFDFDTDPLTFTLGSRAVHAQRQTCTHPSVTTAPANSFQALQGCKYCTLGKDTYSVSGQMDKQNESQAPIPGQWPRHYTGTRQACAYTHGPAASCIRKTLWHLPFHLRRKHCGKICTAKCAHPAISSHAPMCQAAWAAMGAISLFTCGSTRRHSARHS